MEDASEVVAPPRRVLLVSAGASHSVALLSKQASISAHFSFCLACTFCCYFSE